MALEVRGVSYMVDETSTMVARGDLDVIHTQLNCTAVILIGMDVEKIIAAGRHALEIGLDVWFEPHPANMTHTKMLLNLERHAKEIEALRAVFPGRVMLLVGCEFSVHLNAGLPGGFEGLRMHLIRYRRYFRNRINRKVNRLLGRGGVDARAHFHGPISYASASWEEVDWSAFDYAGVNLYRTKNNSPMLNDRLYGHVENSGKPLVITEFGCGAHIGGAQRGPGSFRIVRWFGKHPRVKKDSVRSERVQAAYLADLIDLWDRNSVHGCFVYTFALRDYPHRVEDPKHDLDMASFGIVKVDPENPDRWEPKEAFHEVARLYGEMKKPSWTRRARKMRKAIQARRDEHRARSRPL